MFCMIQLSNHLFMSSTFPQPLEAIIDATAQTMLDTAIAWLVLFAWPCDNITSKLYIVLAQLYCMTSA